MLTNKPINPDCQSTHIIQVELQVLLAMYEKNRKELIILREALEKIMDVYIDSSLGQIVGSEHYEKCWYDCQDIAKEALEKVKE